MFTRNKYPLKVTVRLIDVKGNNVQNVFVKDVPFLVILDVHLIDLDYEKRKWILRLFNILRIVFLLVSTEKAARGVAGT